ncbi:hypothetical protein PGB28_08075 [Primorskyibacter aestuariivivens]|uniref:hypothetical protein n=1 Tax=Primorskyibacter aestuariivivens TaxID=1888912 RepID=UPI0023005E90|nr:hypothetical protein [Primorskyibacter aestuariivivens]MDA7428413.1 hypothetical protein [Primorskyibacter aestuariivivens]
MLSPDQVTSLFTRSDGSYVFARWGRPIAPIVFGVTEGTLPVIKGALEAVVAMAGHHMAETDPELGSNLMIFFFREWDELPEVPDLDKLIPDLGPLVARLKEVGANQYRVFRFDEAGAIKAAFVLLRMDDQLGQVPAETLALGQVVQTMLLWSDTAFRERSPLAVAGDKTILRPEIGALIRAAYDPVMPVAAADASHAFRLAARLPVAEGN